jgi:hypothetical protein
MRSSAAVFLDVLEARDAADVHEVAAGAQAELERRQQAHAAGEHLGIGPVARQQADRLVQRALGGGSRTVPESSRLLSLAELAAAAGAAEVVFVPLTSAVWRAVATVTLMPQMGSFASLEVSLSLTAGLASVLDDLRHDAERDFLGRTRAQVEPGRGEHAIERARGTPQATSVSRTCSKRLRLATTPT